MKTSKKSKITAIFFDFGNVLAVDMGISIDAFFDTKSLPPDKRRFLKKSKIKADLGEIENKDLAKVVKEVFELPYTVSEIQSLYSKTALIRPAWDLYKSLSKNYKTAVLSNNQKGLPQREARHIGIKFKKGEFFNSAEHHVMKPNRDFYITALREFGVKPQESILIDDKPKNVRGARKAGMNALVFDGDMHKLVKGLKKYGIEAKI